MKNPLNKTTGINSLLETILFLEKNHNITGEIIFLDGGYSLL